MVMRIHTHCCCYWSSSAAVACRTPSHRLSTPRPSRSPLAWNTCADSGCDALHSTHQRAPPVTSRHKEHRQNIYFLVFTPTIHGKQTSCFGMKNSGKGQKKEKNKRWTQNSLLSQMWDEHGSCLCFLQINNTLKFKRWISRFHCTVLRWLFLANEVRHCMIYDSKCLLNYTLDVTL